jgi:hypothetical protein
MLRYHVNNNSIIKEHHHDACRNGDACACLAHQMMSALHATATISPVLAKLCRSTYHKSTMWVHYVEMRKSHTCRTTTPPP